MLESLKKLRVPITILFAVIMVPATMFAGLKGRIDRTFSNDGKANVATTMATASDFGRDIAVQPDGKVVVGQLSGASIDPVVVRLNRDASIDTSFDGDRSNDAAVFRPSNSTWFINGTQAGNYTVPFGTAGDLPTPNAYVR